MAERKCRNCLYWHSRLPAGFRPKDESVGECRVNPPALLPAVDPRGGHGKQGAWPETFGGDWCGQFSLHRWPQPGGGFPRVSNLN